jgi:hypothetical protein
VDIAKGIIQLFYERDIVPSTQFPLIKAVPNTVKNSFFTGFLAIFKQSSLPN